MRVVVGTTPVLALNANKNRNVWSITMQPSSVEAGNTGIVFVGRGFQPSPIVGSPSQGEIIKQADTIGESKSFAEDNSVFKGQLWLISDTAGQVVEVYEAAQQ